MTDAVVVRLKSEFGGRLSARARRLEGFTRKVGPTAQVLAELKAALARAKLRQTAQKTWVHIYFVSGEAPINVEFYSAIGEIVLMNGSDFHVRHIVDAKYVTTKVDYPPPVQPAKPPFRACLAADWPRNAAAAPLILAAGCVGGGLAAAAGLASFWVAAPIVALTALAALAWLFTAVPNR